MLRKTKLSKRSNHYKNKMKTHYIFQIQILHRYGIIYTLNYTKLNVKNERIKNGGVGSVKDALVN